MKTSNFVIGSLAIFLTITLFLIALKITTMSHLKTEILLNASKEQVWNTLTSLEDYADWNPFIVSSSGEAVVGQRLTNKMMNKGKATIFNPIVTKADSFREFEWLGIGLMGMFKGRHYFKLEELPDGQTKLIHGEEFSGLLSGLIMKFIGDDTLENFQRMNKALKERVEQSSQDNDQSSTNKS